MSCEDMKSLMYLVLDDMADEAERHELEEHLACCDSCRAEFAVLQAREAQIKNVLASMTPPEGFAAGVMAKIAEPVAAPVVSINTARPRRRRFMQVAGSMAAAAVLLVGASIYAGSGNDVTPLNDDVKLPVASVQNEQPDGDKTVVANNDTQNNDVVSDVVEPQPQVDPPVDVAPVVDEPVADEPSVPVVPEVVLPDAEQIGGTVALPVASYGTEKQGSFDTRLLAAFDETDIYEPSVSSTSSKVTFYTELDGNLQLWTTSLKEATEPTCVGLAEGDIETVVQNNTTKAKAADTAVFSPDKTYIAVNSSAQDERGLWISGTGENETPICLSEDGSGSLVAWAPNSGKLAFTDEQGNLYIGYVAEQRVFKLVSGNVVDVAWSSDSKSLVYISGGNGTHNALYTVLVP